MKLGLTFFGTFIVPILLFGTLLLTSFQRILENNLFAYEESIAGAINKDLDGYFIELNRISRGISSNISFGRTLALEKEDFRNNAEWLSHREIVNDYLGAQINDVESVLGYYLFTDSGVSYSSDISLQSAAPETIIPAPIAAEISVSDRNLIIMRGPGHIFGTKFEDNVLLCAMPISIVRLEEKLFGNGVLVLFVDTTEIDEIFGRHNPEREQVYLYDHLGNFLYSSVPEISYKIIPEKLALLMSAESSGRYRIDGQKDSLLVSFTTSRFGTVKVALFADDATIRDDLFFLNRITIVFLVVLLTVVILFTVFLSFSISSPINRLRSIVTRLEESNYKDASGLIDNRNRGFLSRYFDSLFRFLHVTLTEINNFHQKEKEHELLILQSQINPHFVYNTLNTIRIMAEIDGQERLSKAIRSLIHLLKKSIRIGSVFISIREELDQIHDYIALQNLRYNESFTVQFDVDDAALECRCIKFILQPIIENAIFHGIDPSDGNGLISISIHRDADVIRYSIEDNGSGMNKATISKMLSGSLSPMNQDRIGIQNVNSRLQTYFGPGSKLAIDSRVGRGTIVAYEIPAEIHESK